MFNNYKKNKPTTAARTLPNGRQVSDAQSGTNNIYNEGRQSNIDAGQINQYAQIGTSVGAGATNVMGAYQNPESSYTDKYNSTAKAATGVTSAISPVWGAATQATYSIAAPIKNAMESSGENGRKASYIAGHIFDPLSTFATDAGTGTWSPKAYEKQYQAEHNPQGQFAGGGMNMQPNAEVEKQENTLNPDGTTTQFDGPSHEQGGIPTQLDPGTLIFSDKLKHGGKTFAHLNKANLTHKEDKILNDPSSSNTLKQTAQLMKDTKIKNSISLFKIQEDMKQSKLDNYTKRLGGIQKYPYGGELTTDLNAQQDPRFYNYQGSKMMVPNLKALGKDSGVAPDINLNNYNTLLNTRTQVRDSNVQMGKQLPKFEYINDPTKGDYNTQFENYKKVNVGYFRNGGQLPKYPEGDMFGYRPTNKFEQNKMYQMEKNKMNPQFAQYPTSNSSWITPEMLQNNSGNVEQSSTQAPVKKSTIDYSGYNQQAYNDELSRMNASGGNGNGDKQNWFNRNSDNLYQAGFGLAQNAGQLAYLSEQGKRYDTQQYHTYSPELMNKSAAIRDAKDQARRTAYNVVGKSAGNSGNALSNLIALNAQSTINQSRISQEYDNANASIKNRANEVNLANRYSVDDINAKNKGAALNQYYKTIGSVGTNVAQGMKDNRQMGMDNENIQLMSEFYNSPEAQKMFAKYKKEKGIESEKG